MQNERCVKFGSLDMRVTLSSKQSAGMLLGQLGTPAASERGLGMESQLGDLAFRQEGHISIRQRTEIMGISEEEQRSPSGKNKLQNKTEHVPTWGKGNPSLLHMHVPDRKDDKIHPTPSTRIAGWGAAGGRSDPTECQCLMCHRPVQGPQAATGAQRQ